MDEQRQGLAYGAGAYLLWGLFPVFWPLLDPAGPVEVLAHRIAWSLVFVAALLGFRRRWSWVRELGRRRLGLLTIAATVVSVNWGLYIWGVSNGHVVETSLGYFINPLVTVLLGVAVLGERLRRAQWAALGLGALAVVVLAVDYGRPPWLALTLAVSFATYGLIKKQVRMPAMESLGVETAVLALPAAAYLGWLTLAGDATFTAHGPGHALLMAAAGPVTAVPLLLFGAATRRLPLSTVGLLQYLAPVLQFAFGVLLFHEPMPAARLAGFALVWLALVVFTVESVRHSRRSRPAVEAAGPAVTAPPVRTG
ncbi:MAG TPA: EamA family transporter RarD [Mycobacteriales bacterium]